MLMLRAIGESVGQTYDQLWEENDTFLGVATMLGKGSVIKGQILIQLHSIWLQKCLWNLIIVKLSFEINVFTRSMWIRKGFKSMHHVQLMTCKLEKCLVRSSNWRLRKSETDDNWAMASEIWTFVIAYSHQKHNIARFELANKRLVMKAVY